MLIRRHGITQVTGRVDQLIVLVLVGRLERLGPEHAQDVHLDQGARDVVQHEDDAGYTGQHRLPQFQAVGQIRRGLAGVWDGFDVGSGRVRVGRSSEITAPLAGIIQLGTVPWQSESEQDGRRLSPSEPGTPVWTI